jgi:hypothetical protein
MVKVFYRQPFGSSSIEIPVRRMANIHLMVMAISVIMPAASRLLNNSCEEVDSDNPKQDAETEESGEAVGVVGIRPG